MSGPRRSSAVTITALAAALLVGCAAPGGDRTTGAATSAAVTSEPGCGTGPVVLRARFEAGFPLARALTDEFTRQHPDVTWEVREEQYAVLTQNAPRLLADDPPDLVRLPQVSDLAADGLLRDLDGYAAWFGWDDWPAAHLRQLRVDPGGRPRGTGPLYAMGFSTSVTGVFYNKDLAARIGFREPSTLAEWDDALARAKDAGITPLAGFNSGAAAGLAFPLQGLMAAYGSPSVIDAWTFQQPGARIDTPANTEAVRHLRRWLAAGYFDADLNATDYARMLDRFTSGRALFMVDGDWESATLDRLMPGRVGFFLVPPVRAGEPRAAMTGPPTYGIPAGAAHPDCAAYFLNWAVTDRAAREITVRVGGALPLGPPDAHVPPVEPGSVTAATLAAAARVAADGTGMDFMANATRAVLAESWTPRLQELAAGECEPDDLLREVQADYADQVDR
ncbi:MULTISPECIES: ABC transporter substrate-binding protein [Saccharothrix]|uniref:ABC transporter substrate-binding protein n=1 Tax=Saccharothrix TaxID=2071 RepID=UPI00093F0AB3|nr:extracellular solute-binding protein [Saccharothrix sp. CB00851]OKI35413.1 ABC transporter substrate-binding protein [Saccharothrix sp. CB00851]